MTRQTLPQSSDHYPQTADEPWQAFFFAREFGAEVIAANSLEAWTTDQLLDEALLRSGGDVPALRLMHRRTLEALLAARDRESPNGRA